MMLYKCKGYSEGGCGALWLVTPFGWLRLTGKCWGWWLSNEMTELVLKESPYQETA